MNKPHQIQERVINNVAPGAVKIALVTLFALLWAIWIQPHTIAFRQILLTLGSLLGLYVMSQNIHLFKTRRALPIYLIGLLFVWITFHLFFLSHQYELQLTEYFTIWKRIAWGAPFAIGLGIVLGQSTSQKSTNHDESIFKYEGVWWIFYAGIAAPTVIYLIRTVLMLLARKYGWQLPDFAMHCPPSSSWHITKMSVVFFCLPALALACSQCVRVEDQKNQDSIFISALFIATIAAVLCVFYLENTKNGIAYSMAFILVMLVKIGINKRKRWRWTDTLFAGIAIITMTFLVAQHVEKNHSWRTLIADISVADQIEKNDAWQDYGARGFPTNELGNTVSGGNYLRAAWARVALGLIRETPLGYGLVYKSFGHLARERWPESTLFQAHSAWLDLTLGIGIPGLVLLVLAGVVALKNAWQTISQFWGAIAIWMLSSIALLMITTEVSQQIYIDALVFLILWSAGLGLDQPSKRKTYIAPVDRQI
jgi:O-Antigen ligase